MAVWSQVELNCQPIPEKETKRWIWRGSAGGCGTAADAGESPAAVFRAGVREDSYSWRDGRRVWSVGAGDRWDSGSRATPAGDGRVDGAGSAGSRPWRGESCSFGV